MKQFGWTSSMRRLGFSFNLRLVFILSSLSSRSRVRIKKKKNHHKTPQKKYRKNGFEDRIREPDHDFFEVKGDVRRLVFNQSCSSNTNRLVSFMVWITNLLSSPFIQPSVGHFGNLISSHEVLPKCMSRRRMKGEERKGKDS